MHIIRLPTRNELEYGYNDNSAIQLANNRQEFQDAYLVTVLFNNQNQAQQFLQEVAQEEQLSLQEPQQIFEFFGTHRQLYNISIGLEQNSEQNGDSNDNNRIVRRLANNNVPQYTYSIRIFFSNMNQYRSFLQETTQNTVAEDNNNSNDTSSPKKLKEKNDGEDNNGSASTKGDSSDKKSSSDEEKNTEGNEEYTPPVVRDLFSQNDQEKSDDANNNPVIQPKNSDTNSQQSEPTNQDNVNVTLCLRIQNQNQPILRYYQTGPNEYRFAWSQYQNQYLPLSTEQRQKIEQTVLKILKEKKGSLSAEQQNCVLKEIKKMSAKNTHRTIPVILVRPPILIQHTQQFIPQFIPAYQQQQTIYLPPGYQFKKH
ncbi:MAG: hypothetical protein WCH10_05890 [bacterium]